MKNKSERTIVFFLPTLSVIIPPINDPITAPRIAIDTIVSFSRFVIFYPLLKFTNKFTPPITPVSYPNNNPPKHDDIPNFIINFI